MGLSNKTTKNWLTSLHFGLIFEPVKSVQDNMVTEEGLYPEILEVL